MKITLYTAVTAATLAALAIPAVAQETYPRLVGGADDMRVEYGPGPHGNIVGGGPVTIENTGDGRVAMTYLDPNRAQARNDGLVPWMLGGEEDRTVTWLPPVGRPGQVFITYADGGLAGARRR
jgi:hypothetical protein